jgi:hypothetical protein
MIDKKKKDDNNNNGNNKNKNNDYNNIILPKPLSIDVISDYDGKCQTLSFLTASSSFSSPSSFSPSSSLSLHPPGTYLVGIRVTLKINNNNDNDDNSKSDILWSDYNSFIFQRLVSFSSSSPSLTYYLGDNKKTKKMGKELVGMLSISPPSVNELLVNYNDIIFEGMKGENNNNIMILYTLGSENSPLYIPPLRNNINSSVIPECIGVEGNNNIYY